MVIPEQRLIRGLVLPGGITTPMAREATLEEIETIENETAASAVRCRNASFDGIEVAAHMSYFLASFLTPRSNRRTDRYGGSVENRARILVNIVTKMRALVGRDYPIGLRIACSEQGPRRCDRHHRPLSARQPLHEARDHRLPGALRSEPAHGHRIARPGQWPPAARLLQTPVEQAMLTLSRSWTFMGLVGRMKKQ